MSVHILRNESQIVGVYSTAEIAKARKRSFGKRGHYYWIQVFFVDAGTEE